MRWCVVYNPDLQQAAVIAETALENHRLRGWRRVSDWATDQTLLHPGDFDRDVDLDEETKPKTSKKNAAAAADSDKEHQS